MSQPFSGAREQGQHAGPRARASQKTKRLWKCARAQRVNSQLSGHCEEQPRNQHARQISPPEYVNPKEQAHTYALTATDHATDAAASVA